MIIVTRWGEEMDTRQSVHQFGLTTRCSNVVLFWDGDGEDSVYAGPRWPSEKQQRALHAVANDASELVAEHPDDLDILMGRTHDGREWGVLFVHPDNEVNVKELLGKSL